MFYISVILAVQAVLLVTVFDKFSYFYAAAYFTMAAFAAHYQLSWAWQMAALTIGVFCESAVYRIDIWQKGSNPLKFFTKTSVALAIGMLLFCVCFAYQLNHKINFLPLLLTVTSIHIWILIFFASLSCLWGAIGITDYLSPKKVTVCNLQIKQMFSKNIPRAGVTNYLWASANGTDYKFVLTSVAYDVLKNKSEVKVNLLQGYSGAVFVNNDFLRDQRGPWRMLVFKTMLVLLALVVIAAGFVFYLAVKDI